MATREAVEDPRTKQTGKLINLESLLAQNASKLTHNLSVRATLNSAVLKEDEKYFSKQVYSFFTNESNIPQIYKQIANQCLADDSQLALLSGAVPQPEAVLMDTDRSVHIMQTSGLSRDILSVIWQRVSRTSKDGRLCKFEFYIALALIGAHQQRWYVRSLEELLTYPALPQPGLSFGNDSTTHDVKSSSGNSATLSGAFANLNNSQFAAPSAKQQESLSMNTGSSPSNSHALNGGHVNSDANSHRADVDDEFGDFADFQSASSSQSHSVQPAQASVDNHVDHKVQVPSHSDKYAALRELIPEVAPVAPSAPKPTVRAAVRDHLVASAASSESNSNNNTEEPSDSRTPSDWSASVSSSASAGASASASQHDSPMHMAFSLARADYSQSKPPQLAAVQKPLDLQTSAWQSSAQSDWEVMTSRPADPPPFAQSSMTELIAIDFTASSSSLPLSLPSLPPAAPLAVKSCLENELANVTWPSVVTEPQSDQLDEFDDFLTAVTPATLPVTVPMSLAKASEQNDQLVAAPLADTNNQAEEEVKPEQPVSTKDTLNEQRNLEFRDEPTEFKHSNGHSNLNSAAAESAKVSDQKIADSPDQRLAIWRACVDLVDRFVTEIDSLVCDLQEAAFRHLCTLREFQETCSDLTAIRLVALRIRRSANLLRNRLASDSATLVLNELEEIMQRSESRWQRLAERCSLLSNSESESESDCGGAACEICMQSLAAASQSTVTRDNHHYHLECANVYLHQCSTQTLPYSE